MSEPLVSTQAVTGSPAGVRVIRFEVVLGPGDTDLGRVEAACRRAVTQALAASPQPDRVDAARRRRAWAAAVPAGLLVAGVAGVAVAPFGWAALAAAMAIGFMGVAGFGRLATA